jgi:bacterial/archaeal transporter family protein
MWWIFFSLLSSLATAVVTVLTKLGLDYLDPIVLTALQTFVTSLALIFVVFYSKSPLTFYSTSNSSMIIIMGIVMNIFSYIFFAYALKHGPVIPVSAIYLLNLPLTLFISAVMLNDAVSIKVIIGTALMFGGAVLLTI